MAITPAHEAIAMLIDLAKRGEIDPWDVQVIEVIDRFLSELGLLDTNDPLQSEADLPQSGQAFLWASMLVLLKADTLQSLQEQQEQIESEPFLDEEVFPDGDAQANLPLNLERHLRRRTAVMPLHKRRVTLSELIEQLEYIAAELEVTATNSRPRRSSNSRREAIRTITQLAHNENLTELAMQLEKFLYFNIPQLAPGEDYIDWEQLLSLWQTQDSQERDSSINKHSASHPDSSDRAGVFWALLLLSAQSKVELSQQEFYQDLSIRPLCHQSNLSRLRA